MVRNTGSRRCGSRGTRSSLVLLAVLAVAGCNATTAESPAPAPSAAQASLVTPAGFRLPEGTGCAGEIARFRAIQDNDLATGHVARVVYDRIQQEIRAAEALCSGGNDSAARAAIAATRRRHGYPG